MILFFSNRFLFRVACRGRGGS